MFKRVINILIIQVMLFSMCGMNIVSAEVVNVAFKKPVTLSNGGSGTIMERLKM